MTINFAIDRGQIPVHSAEGGQSRPPLQCGMIDSAINRNLKGKQACFPGTENRPVMIFFGLIYGGDVPIVCGLDLVLQMVQDPFNQGPLPGQGTRTGDGSMSCIFFAPDLKLFMLFH